MLKNKLTAAEHGALSRRPQGPATWQTGRSSDSTWWKIRGSRNYRRAIGEFRENNIATAEANSPH